MLIGAIEAGGTKMVCGLGDEEGNIIEEVKFPTRTPRETIPEIINFFKDKNIKKMGVGSFGPVQVNSDSEKYGIILETPKTDWKYFNLLQTLKSNFPNISFVIDTDVNAAAYGEMKWGAALGLDSCAYFTVGTGIGVGAVVDNNLVHGLLHPEAGHMFIKRHSNDDFKGSCPYHNDCLEGLASGTAMEARWGKRGTEIKAEMAWEIEAYYLAQATVNVFLTYSPKKIILGGGVMNHPGLINKVRENFVRLLNGYLQKDFINQNAEHFISLPGLGDEAGLKGALALAIDQ